MDFFKSSYNASNETPIDNSQQSLNEKIVLKRDSMVVSDENSWENDKLPTNEIKEDQNIVNISATVDFDTLQKTRQDLIGEIQVIIEYDEHIHSTTNQLARETWEDIKREELIHAGELMALINYLDSSQKQYVENGWKEFNDRLNKK